MLLTVLVVVLHIFIYFVYHDFQALEAFWSCLLYFHFCSGHMNDELSLVYSDFYYSLLKFILSRQYCDKMLSYQNP